MADMNLLLIEDDISKEKAICGFLSEMEAKTYRVVAKHSVMSGKIELKNNVYDCVLLDMTLPLFDNDDLEHNQANMHEYDPFGGVAVLDEIDRVGLKCKVIILTAYDVLGEGESQKNLKTLTEELKANYSNLVVDSIFFNASSNDWSTKLFELICHIETEQTNEDLDN